MAPYPAEDNFYWEDLYEFNIEGEFCYFCFVDISADYETDKITDLLSWFIDMISSAQSISKTSVL